MQRYFADVDQQFFVHLTKDDEHHVLHVMRMKKGDEIEVVSNQKVYLCRLDNINPLTISAKSFMRARILSLRSGLKQSYWGLSSSSKVISPDNLVDAKIGRRSLTEMK